MKVGNIDVFTYPDQAYVANPFKELSPEAYVLVTTRFSFPRS